MFADRRSQTRILVPGSSTARGCHPSASDLEGHHRGVSAGCDCENLLGGGAETLVDRRTFKLIEGLCG
jgi:hypothetical protein